MIGSATFCWKCKKPMRSCVMPAMCSTCRFREQEERLAKEGDKPIVVKAAQHMSNEALDSGASEELLR